MTFRRRVFPFVVSVLGIVGAVACAIAIVGVCRVGSRFRNTTENAFAKVDASLIAIQDRTQQIRERLKESALTTESIASSVRDWAERSAGERLALNLDVAGKSERLLVVMQRSDHLLEVSFSSAETVQQTLSLVSAIGIEIDGAIIDAVINEIASLREQLGEATAFVQKLHEQTTATDEASEGRLQQAAQLALRAIATLGSIDARIGQVQTRLLETGKKSQALLARSLGTVKAVTIATVALLIWMAAGQMALSYLAWRSFRSR